MWPTHRSPPNQTPASVRDRPSGLPSAIRVRRRLPCQVRSTRRNTLPVERNVVPIITWPPPAGRPQAGRSQLSLDRLGPEVVRLEGTALPGGAAVIEGDREGHGPVSRCDPVRPTPLLHNFGARCGAALDELGPWAREHAIGVKRAFDPVAPIVHPEHLALVGAVLGPLDRKAKVDAVGPGLTRAVPEVVSPACGRVSWSDDCDRRVVGRRTTSARRRCHDLKEVHARREHVCGRRHPGCVRVDRCHLLVLP